MEVGVENGEVGHAGKQVQRLAHDVDGDGCVQRRKSLVAFDLVDELGRDELVFADGWTSAHRAMADGCRGREIAGVKRVDHELECHGEAGHRRRLVHELFAAGVLNPEFAEVGADAVDRALVQLEPPAVAGLIDRKFNGR